MPATESRPPTRIAVVLQGDPTDPKAWSGVPGKLLKGLEAASCEAVPVSAQFPGGRRLARLLGMSWVDQAASRRYAAACGAAADRALRRSGPLDGAVAIGSGYALSGAVPFATFEDMTLAQALRLDDPTYGSLSAEGSRRWLDRQTAIYRRSRACCVASHWAGASVCDDYGIDPAKVHSVGFGRNAEPQAVERRWDTPRFLFVGVDWRRKRGEAVVEAFTAVRRHHPEARLDLVGGHPPVDADGVTTHGRLALDSAEDQRKYNALIQNATCLVMPSFYEPFGIAYLDAAATGLPSIGTTVGGARHAIGPGGIVVDPRSDDALTAAMLELAEPATARRLGALAQERAQLFSWRAVAERLLRALEPPGLPAEGLADFLDPAPTPEAEAR